MAYASTNPYTGEVLKTFATATDAEVEQAISVAHAAFLTWRDASFAERAKVMREAAAILRRETDDFARLLTLEMGKLFCEGRLEVALSADILDHYAVHAERLLVADLSEGS